MAGTSQLKTAEQIAEIVGGNVKARAILRWANLGLIPSVRVNQRVIRFDEKEVTKAFRKLKAQ